MGQPTLTPRQRAFLSWMEINKLTFVGLSDETGVPYSSLKSFATKPGQGMIDRNIDKITATYGLTVEDIFVTPVKIGATDPETVNSGSDKDIAQIPEYDLRVSAGGGYFVDREIVKAHWPFPHGYLTQELRLNPGTLSIVEVFGDSMSPTLESGDRVMVDHGDCNPARPGIYAIWDSSATVVKRLEKIPASNPVELVLISDNKNHNQYKVLAENVNIIGRVVWYARRL